MRRGVPGLIRRSMRVAAEAPVVSSRQHFDFPKGLRRLLQPPTRSLIDHRRPHRQPSQLAPRRGLRGHVARASGRTPSNASTAKSSPTKASSSSSAPPSGKPGPPHLGVSDKWEQIYRRDRYRCTSPVCHQRNVTLHHVQYRANGGTDAPENLTTPCAFCHLEGEHAGRLKILPPGDNPTWLLGRHPIIKVHRRERTLLN